MELVESAILSPDLSFAVSICCLINGSSELKVSNSLVNALLCNDLFDNFLRCLAIGSLNEVLTPAARESPYTIALGNMWLCTCSSIFRHKRAPTTLEELLSMMSRILQKNRTLYGNYLAKALLTMAAYWDQSGDSILALLVEVFVRPLANSFSLGNKIDELKVRLLKNEKTPEREALEQLAVHCIRSKATTIIDRNTLGSDIFCLNEFIDSRLEKFLNLVVFLNTKFKEEHPSLLLLDFVYRTVQ